MDQKIEREGAQEDENEGADERANRTGDAAHDGDNQDVDAAFDRDRARRNLPVVPDLEHAAERGDKGCEGIGRDAVRIDVEAERGHAARIVAHALQREAERCAREVEHREIAERRGGEDQVVEGTSARQSTPQKCGVTMVLMPVWPLKMAQFWLVK